MTDTVNSTHTVFCNFLVAKPRFRKPWLALCERFFDVAETGSSGLQRSSAFRQDTIRRMQGQRSA